MYNAVMASHVVLFQETRTPSPISIMDIFPDHHVYHNGDKSHLPGHGLITVVRKHPCVSASHKSSSRYALHITLRAYHKSIHILNIYIPPHGSNHNASRLNCVWREISDRIVQAQSTACTIAGGDWNTSGAYMLRKFHELQQHTNMSALQHAHTPFTFHNTRGNTSVVDHFLSSNRLYPSIRMLPSPSSSPSDHIPIRCSLRLHTHHSQATPLPPAYLSGDVIKFVWKDNCKLPLTQRIKEAFHDLHTPHEDTAQSLSARLISTLHEAAAPLGLLVTATCAPSSQNHHHHTHRRPFTLPKEALMIKQQIRILASSGAAPNYLKELRRSFKKQVAWAKIRVAYLRGRQLANGLRSAPRKTWAAFKRNTSTFSPSAINLTVWHTHYASLFTEAHNLPIHDWSRYVNTIHSDNQQQVHEDLCKGFSIDEMLAVMKDCNKHAAQGVDAIPTELLSIHWQDESGTKHYPILESLIPLYNKVLRGERQPISWDLSVVSPLYKGKGEVDNPSSYRPLSLSTVFYRFYMAILTHRLQITLEDFSLLPDTQYGFRANRSACHANLLLQEACLYDDHATHAAFMDLSQAYDRVHHNSLFSIMKCMGIPDSFVWVLRRAYAKACFCVHTSHGFTSVTPYTRGLRQGCPMSPVLFNIYFSVVDKWLRIHSPLAFKCIGVAKTLQGIYYADDATLVSDTRVGLQALVSEFEACISRLHLVINISKGKSGVVAFKERGNVASHTPITTCAGPLENCSSYCHLGVVFSGDMSWKLAYDYRFAKAERSFQGLLHDLRAKKCSDIWAASMVFNTHVLSTMLYGVQIWGWEKFATFKLWQNPWQSLHARTMKSAMHLPKSTSDIILCLESGTWPMMFYAISRVFKFAHTIRRTNSDILNHLVDRRSPGGFLDRLQVLLDRLPEGSTNKDRLQKAFLRDLNEFNQYPRDAQCNHRRIASYLYYAWDGKLHSRHPIHKWAMPFHEYRLCLFTRLMIVRVPMFSSNVPFAQRICPLCHDPYGDLEHLLTECPHFALVRYTKLPPHADSPNISWVLKSKHHDIWNYVVTVLSMFRAATSG